MLKIACLFLVLLFLASSSSNAAPGQAAWGQQDTLSAMVGQIVQTHTSSGASSHGGMNHGPGFESSNNGQRFSGSDHNHNTRAHHGSRGGAHSGYEPNCSVFESAREEVKQMLNARLNGRLSPQLVQNLHSHLIEVISTFCNGPNRGGHNHHSNRQNFGH